MSHGGLGHSGGHGSPVGEHGLLEQAAHRLGPVLTLGYALLSIVGITFETLLLREFHVDFLTYAEPEDFLMAGLRHPVVLAFVGASIGMIAAMLWAVRWGTAVSERYAAWRDRSGSLPLVNLVRRAAPFAAVIYYFFTFTRIYAGYHADAIRSGEEATMRLEFQHYSATPDSPSTEGVIVATTGRYVFLWDSKAQRMQVIPVSAVRQLLSGAELAKTPESKVDAPNAPESK